MRRPSHYMCYFDIHYVEEVTSLLVAPCCIRNDNPQPRSEYIITGAFSQAKGKALLLYHGYLYKNISLPILNNYEKFDYAGHVL